MEIVKLQEKVSKIFFDNLVKDEIACTDDYLLLKLTEEVGEFIQSYLIDRKRCRKEKYLKGQDSKKELDKELSDVLGLVFVIATRLDIDLEKSISKKWITKEWVQFK